MRVRLTLLSFQIQFNEATHQSKASVLRFSNKQLQLKLNEKNGYQITFLLESDWINKNSNEFHEDALSTKGHLSTQVLGDCKMCTIPHTLK